MKRAGEWSPPIISSWLSRPRTRGPSTCWRTNDAELLRTIFGLQIHIWMCDVFIFALHVPTSFIALSRGGRGLSKHVAQHPVGLSWFLLLFFLLWGASARAKVERGDRRRNPECKNRDQGVLNGTVYKVFVAFWSNSKVRGAEMQ